MELRDGRHLRHVSYYKFTCPTSFSQLKIINLIEIEIVCNVLPLLLLPTALYYFQNI